MMCYTRRHAPLATGRSAGARPGPIGGSAIDAWSEKGFDRAIGGVTILRKPTRVVPVDATHCTVTFTYHADLGGDFGKSGNEKAWHDEPPLYFGALRKNAR